MPPHLHPRSTATSTLFAGTLLASFIVVGIPHVFPCPAPRKGYADSEIRYDSEGRPIRRVRRKRDTDESKVAAPAASVLGNQETIDVSVAGNTKSKTLQQEAELFKQLEAEAILMKEEARECPVPKPKGILGKWLGFAEEQKIETQRCILVDGKSGD